MKKWQVKNAIGMWKKDPSISMTCAEERAVTPRPSFTTTTPAWRPSYTTTRPTQRPSYGTTRRPTYGTTTPTPRPSYIVCITDCTNPYLLLLTTQFFKMTHVTGHHSICLSGHVEDCWLQVSHDATLDCDLNR